MSDLLSNQARRNFMAIAASTGAGLIGTAQGTAADAIDAKRLATYAALRVYVGVQKNVQITGYMVATKPAGIAGMFVRDDSDTTSADNSGTIIVGSDGRRWKRAYTGPVNVMWFGASGTLGTDDAPAFTLAFLAGKSVALGGVGYTHSIQSYVGLPVQDLYNPTPHRLVGNGGTISIEATQAPFTSASFAANPALATNPFTGKLFVQGVNFIGAAVDGAFDCDHIYNLQVIGCHFANMGQVFSSRRAKTGHASGYIQSLFVHDSIFSNITDKIIRAKEAYNVVFDGNLCEQCAGGIYIDSDITTYAIHNIRLTNNLFEGGGVFARLTHTIAGVITGNYFEKNTIGDIGTNKCHLDLNYDAAGAGSSNPCSWVIDGNSSQDYDTQRADVDFAMMKISGSYNTVAMRGNWCDSVLTNAPIRNISSNYSRRVQKYILPTSAIERGIDSVGGVLPRPLSYSLITGNRLQFISLQLGEDIAATDFRGACFDLSVVLKGKVATGEVFSECAFNVKIFLSPIGSGVPLAKGKTPNWDARFLINNYLEQSAGIVVDSVAGANTVSMFPAGITGPALEQSGTIIHFRAIGFDAGSIPGYGPLTTVDAHITGTVNALSDLPGTAVNWVSFVN